MHQFISYDSQCPNITFCTVCIPLYCLWRHVVLGSYIVSKTVIAFTCLYRKTEISQLEYSLLHQHVSRFQISVDEPQPMHLGVGFQQHPHDRLRLQFRKLLLLLHYLRNILSFTILRHYVEVVFAAYNFKQTQSVTAVGLAQGFQQRYFIGHKFLFQGVSFGQLNNFNCNLFIQIIFHVLVLELRPRYTRELNPKPICSDRANWKSLMCLYGTIPSARMISLRCGASFVTPLIVSVTLFSAIYYTILRFISYFTLFIQIYTTVVSYIIGIIYIAIIIHIVDIINQMQLSFALHEANLVPVYVVEESLKKNFKTITAFIKHSCTAQQTLNQRINQIDERGKLQNNQQAQSLRQISEKILASLSSDLNARIESALRPKISNFIVRLENIQKKDQRVQGIINRKLQSGRKQSREETVKTCMELINKFNNKKEIKSKNKIENVQEVNQIEQRKEGDEGKNVQKQIQKIKQYLISFDNKYFENQSSLKSNWKQFILEFAQYRKMLNAKLDEVKIQVYKMKSGMSPEQKKELQKSNVADRISKRIVEMHEQIASCVKKSQYDWGYSQWKNIFERHDEQIGDLRKEQDRNNQYFTFYMLNADEESVSNRINGTEQRLNVIQKQIIQSNALFVKIQKQNQVFLAENNKQIFQNQFIKIKQMINQLDQKISNIKEKTTKIQKNIQISKQKIQLIHFNLDENSHEQLTQKQRITNHIGKERKNDANIKELKDEINRLKDDIFVLNHTQRETISNLNKVIKQTGALQQRVQKIKIETQQSLLTRKPWVCLSCDRNVSDLKKDTIRKKASDPKILDQKSMQSRSMSKIFKATEKDIQAHANFKEKYLGPKIKFPQILKQKLLQYKIKE